MKYFRCSGQLCISKEDIIIKAANKQEAQREFECWLENKLCLEDFEAEEIEEPDFWAINE